MASGSATTASGYLWELPTERRAAIAVVRRVIERHLPCLTRADADSANTRSLKGGFKAAGKKPHMGRSCLRLPRPEDPPLQLIGEVIASRPVERFNVRSESSRRRH